MESKPTLPAAPRRQVNETLRQDVQQHNLRENYSSFPQIADHQHHDNRPPAWWLERVRNRTRHDADGSYCPYNNGGIIKIDKTVEAKET